MKYITVGLVFVVMILIISIIHELGHYMFLKKFRVPVKEFSIGIGPEIWRVRRNNTKWTLRSFLFLAYVDFDEQGASYQNLRKWEKLFILGGGIINNVILGLVLLIPVFLNPSLMYELILAMEVNNNLGAIANLLIIISRLIKEGFVLTVIFTGIFSLLAAMFNIIPIPGLDGGWILFTLIGIPEKKVKKLSTTYLNIINAVTYGVVLLDIILLIIHLLRIKLMF